MTSQQRTARKSTADGTTSPDAPGGVFTHWISWGLDPAADGLGERESAPPRSGALIATGSFLVVATLVAWSRLVAIDAVALPPTRELSLLSAVPLFEPLSVAAKEHLASRLGARSVPAGATIVSEGEPATTSTSWSRATPM